MLATQYNEEVDRDEMENLAALGAKRFQSDSQCTKNKRLRFCSITRVLRDARRNEEFDCGVEVYAVATGSYHGSVTLTALIVSKIGSSREREPALGDGNTSQ